ncbi:hypothetical protein [Marinigracilibium pacificum]|uniref:Uncharacterized protein n=1 Tax=Marinigracilibium pacificum TaxID=2729599 RepID=A0A848IZ48_9BACT|nr:hypothetical protein [Marinigracilibium pacificum]NMM48631.1 hypothetical protein [Marinigracilibium pacificum]
MKEYLIIYTNGKTENVIVPDKQTLINAKFKGDKDVFMKKVKMLQWNTLSMKFVEHVKSGRVDAVISTADANPFGWRV